MRRKKMYSLLLLVTVFAMLLAACGANPSSPEGDPSSSEGDPSTGEQTPPVDASDEIVLTYWGWDSQFYGPMMDAYTELHPNVRFEVTEVASADYVTKLQQTIASGAELPDILASEATYRGQQLAMDIWEDLSQAPYNVSDDIFLDSALPKMKNPDGKIVCIDETVCPSAFAYKKDLAKEYLGTDNPEELEAMFATVEDVITKAQEVHDASNGEVYLFVTIGSTNQWLSNLKAVSLEDEAGNINFTEKYKEPLEMVCKLRDAGGIDVIQWWSPQDNAAYAQSKHILFPAANWSMVWSIQANDPDGSGNWGLFTPPGGGFTWGGTAMGINKDADSAKKEVAWDFIKFCVMTQEGVDLMKEVADYYTPVKEFYEDPSFTSDVSEYFGGQDVGNLLYNVIAPTMPVSPVTQYDGVCDEAVALVLQNIMADDSYTAEEALADSIVEVQNRLPDATVK